MDKNNKSSEAIQVRVLETNVLHASDVIYWLDGSSADTESEMDRIELPLQVIFSEKPNDLRVLTTKGRMALWRTAQQVDPVIVGRATQTQLERPTLATFSVAGEVHDPHGLFHPAGFSTTVGDGSGGAVVLYPTLTGTKTPPSGNVLGRLRYADSGNPVIWGLVELEVTLAGSNTLILRSQADKHGDFILALHRLPPLPESITEYDAVLRLTVDPAATATVAPNTNHFVNAQLESVSVTDNFQTELDLEIRPGERTRINSFNKDYLAISVA